MNYRSWEFLVLPAILIGIAVSLPIQSAILFETSFTDFSAMFQNLTILNWMIFALSLATAVALLGASQITLYLAPLLILIVAWNNIIVGSYNTHFDLTATSIASVAFVFLFVPLIRRPVRTVLLDSRVRWWRPAKRKKLALGAVLNPIKGHQVCAATHDLSESGAFIAIDDPNIIKNLPEGQLLRLNLSLNSLRQIRCEAVVVRACEDPLGSYPRGCGIRFVEIDSSQRKRIREFIAEP